MADFLSLDFASREIYDITIALVNADPIEVSITKGDLLSVTHVIDAGIARTDTGKVLCIKPFDIKNGNFSNAFTGICRPGFILMLDCSKDNESYIYHIRSSDIRNIIKLNPDPESDLTGVILTSEGQDGQYVEANGDGKTADWVDYTKSNEILIQDI